MIRIQLVEAIEYSQTRIAGVKELFVAVLDMGLEIVGDRTQLLALQVVDSLDNIWNGIVVSPFHKSF